MSAPTVEFCEAISGNDVQQIRQLASEFPQLLSAALGTVPITGLHFAAEEGREDSIIELIQLGADVNSMLGGSPPLHYAVLHAPTSTIELLLQHGADPNLVSKDNETAMLLAARKRALFDESDEQVVPELLERYGAKLDIHSAAALGRLESVREILATNRQAIRESLRPNEILLNGSCRRSSELMQVLLEHGADATAVTESGRCPLEFVLSSAPCDPVVVRLLIEYGADPNIAMNDRGETLADFSKSMGQPQEVLDLLSGSN